LSDAELVSIIERAQSAPTAAEPEPEQLPTDPKKVN
jgi:hypothetical protein